MNIKKILIGTAAGAFMLGMAIVPAFAAGFQNGGFETGTLIDPVFTTLFGGDSTSIPGWTVVSGSVDYIGSYWDPSEGSRSIDMSGNGAGTISQTFDTVSGHKYIVTFDMAGNPDGGSGTKTMTANVGSGPIPFSFDVTTQTKDSMGWSPMDFTFTATGSSTSLTFASTTETPFGPALDNVMVKQFLPTTKDDCKKDGWKLFGIFKNQGDCVSYVATGGKNPPAGL